MTMVVRFLACVLALAVPLAGAAAQRGTGYDQQAATRGRAAGSLMPLREIERRVLPYMAGAEYIGFDFDSATAIYTLKFVRNGTVIWVDVDGRSGHVLRRTGR